MEDYKIGDEVLYMNTICIIMAFGINNDVHLKEGWHYYYEVPITMIKKIPK